MGRREDLEQSIHESSKIIKQYEAIIRTSNRPEETVRAQRIVERQRDLIEEYQAEIDALTGNAANSADEATQTELPDSSQPQGSGCLLRALRDPIWQGVGVLIAVAALIITVCAWLWPNVPPIFRPSMTSTAPATPTLIDMVPSVPSETPTSEVTPTPTPSAIPTAKVTLTHTPTPDPPTPTFTATPALAFTPPSTSPAAPTPTLPLATVQALIVAYAQRVTPSPQVSEIRYENLIADSTPSAKRIVVSDSCGTQETEGLQEQWGHFQDHRWELQERGTGWKVTALFIQDSPPTDVTTDFEDGTVGCWYLAQEDPHLPGSNLHNSTAQSHLGTHSLSFQIDLSRPKPLDESQSKQDDPSKPRQDRVRIEHRTDVPLYRIQNMTAYVLYRPLGDEVPLQAVLYYRDEFGKPKPGDDTAIATLGSGHWNPVANRTLRFHQNAPWAYVVGLEIRLRDGLVAEHVRGVIYVDDLTIESEVPPEQGEN